CLGVAGFVARVVLDRLPVAAEHWLVRGVVDRARCRGRRPVGGVVGLVEAGAAGVAGREGDGDVVVDVGARRVVRGGGGGAVDMGGRGVRVLGVAGFVGRVVLDDLAVAGEHWLARRVVDQAERRGRGAVGRVVGL